MPRELCHGEYWIINTTSVFADGDVGDKTHERIVWEHLFSQVQDLEPFRSFFPSESDGCDPTMIREALNNWADLQHKEGKLSEEIADDPYDYLYEQVKDTLDREGFNVLFDINPTEARDYACRVLKWIRVADTSVQAPDLTSQTLKRLAEGLYDAFDSECLRATFDIEDWSKHSSQAANHRCRIYYGVPYHVIDSGDPSELLQYRNPQFM